MTKIRAQDIGKKFLEDLDKFLRDNLQILKCSDIYDIYNQFVFIDLKKFRGNSNGFTGLSEYLIFRFLFHQLGGSFDPKKVTAYLWEFVSKSGEIRIGQSVPVIVDQKCYPDIVVYYFGKLIAVIQIKLYLTKGLKEIMETLKTLEKLKASHSELRALLIIFSGLSKRGKILLELKRISDDKKWFKFLILEENNALLKQKLGDSLGLNRITVSSSNSK